MEILPYELQEHEVKLSEFLEMFQAWGSALESQDGLDALQRCVTTILEPLRWDTLVLDVPLPETEIAEKTYDALLCSEKITGFVLCETLPTNSSARLLRRGLPLMQQFALALFTGYSMNAAEAKEVFSLLQTVKSPRTLGFFPLQEYDDEVIDAFARFVKESSSLDELIVAWSCRHHVPMNSLELFQSICEAVGQSPSINELCLMSFPVDESNYNWPRHLANAIASSSSLVTLEMMNDDEDFVDETLEALRKTSAYKSFDLGFCQQEHPAGGGDVLKFTRPSPWKSLLSNDIPLNVWPLILSETKAWNGNEKSHKTRDILFFLLKEKSDVLLQNVKRRRIRKRKRYGYDSC